MKAITIWQPWASLWVCGAKKFETRSWATFYRGSIAIHAAGKDPKAIFKALPINVQREISTFLIERYFLWENVPCGAVIATAELVGCHKIVRHGGRGMSADGPGWLETDHGIYEPTDQELLFGDWTPGRYAWEITNVKLLDTPIPAKGRQGLWRWEAAQAGEAESE